MLKCHLFLEPGDEVIVTEFGFIMHRIYASLCKAKVLLAKEKQLIESKDRVFRFHSGEPFTNLDTD